MGLLNVGYLTIRSASNIGAVSEVGCVRHCVLRAMANKLNCT